MKMKMEMKMKMTNDKNYYFRVGGGEWSSMVVAENTDTVDLIVIKKGGESKQ